MTEESMRLTALTEELTGIFGERLRCNEPMSAHTSFRIGGPADMWLQVVGLGELITAVQLARSQRVPFLVLGSGSNVLVSDGGIRGLVLENRANAVYFDFHNSVVHVIVETGALLTRFAYQCMQRGLGGLEWAIGIPGTVGGAVVGNAGAFGFSVSDKLLRVEVLSPDGVRSWFDCDWMKFDYRESCLKGGRNSGYVVLRAEFVVKSQPVEILERRVKEYNAHRAKLQPSGTTAGSMFKNPQGDYAGRLIEAAGLKGLRVGRAQISPVHANFFTNLGGATSADVWELVQKARSAVLEKFGVELEPEVEFLGEW